jgi:hypothetical protein
MLSRRLRPITFGERPADAFVQRAKFIRVAYRSEAIEIGD